VFCRWGDCAGAATIASAGNDLSQGRTIRPRRTVPAVAIDGIVAAEIAAKSLQGDALDLNFACRSVARPAQDRKRRTPTLNGMLEQEGGYQCGQRQPAFIDCDTQHHTRERERGGIRL